MKKNAMQFYLVAVLLGPMLACAPTESIIVTEKQDAMDALNRRDYERAIAILEQLRRRDSRDSEVSTLLASAYGGSVGLNVIDSFSAFGPLLFDASGKSNSKALGLADSAQTDYVNPTPEKVLKHFTKFFEALGDGAALYFNMPYAKIESRPRLVSALLLIQEIDRDEGDYDKAQALAVLLNIAQSLNYLRDAFPGFNVDNPKEISISNLACSISPTALFENLKASVEYASQGLNAWQIVTTERNLPFKPRMQSAQVASRQILEFIQDKQSGAVVADVLSNKLKQQFCD